MTTKHLLLLGIPFSALVVYLIAAFCEMSFSVIEWGVDGRQMFVMLAVIFYAPLLLPLFYMLDKLGMMKE